MHVGQFPPIAHFICEVLAFAIGGKLYYAMKTRDSLTDDQRVWVVVGGCIGAAIGCKLIYWLEDPLWYLNNLSNWQAVAGGKALVGALAGGWIGVESAKAKLGVKSATGDTFTIPLIVGMIVGRIGCFLTGFYDRTYGIPTTLPWAVDFGDGVTRHPTQLYEIIFLLLLLGFIQWRAKCCAYEQGTLFRIFILGYFGFRFFVEFLKPIPHVYFGLDAEQLVAILAYVYYGIKVLGRKSKVEAPAS